MKRKIEEKRKEDGKKVREVRQEHRREERKARSGGKGLKKE